MINPILAAAFGSIARWALALGAGYLVKANIWTESEAITYVTAGALAATALMWSLWNKYLTRRKLLVALTLPPTSEAVVDRKIASGVPSPSVTTPANVVPVPPTP